MPWLLVVVGAPTLVPFAALTVAVTTNPTLALDSRAFETADDLRMPWLDKAAEVVTKLGLIAIVAPAVALASWVLVRRRHRMRAAGLVSGTALAWTASWITKAVVDRPRPPEPLVRTAGQSYPSAHAANSIGWLALAIGLTVVIPGRNAKVVAVAGGGLLALLVGLSRIYLRAHYTSDVVAGWTLALAMYALAAIGTVAWERRRECAQ